MHMRVFKRVGLAILINMTLWVIAPVTCADPPSKPTSNPEYELRAAVVIGILRFATQYDHDGAEYPLCLIGTPPSGEKVAQGRGINISKDRKLTVQSITPDSSTASCAAIVIGPTLTAAQQATVAEQAKINSSILICDDCVDDSNAHVSLRRKGERVVFAIDLALAQQSQIAFSSKLLSLAVEIRH